VAYKSYFRDRRFSLLILAAASFGVGQLGFFLALKSLNLGLVYMATGLIQVLVLWSSRVLLKETVSAHQALAVGAIVFGVALYAL
jgi:drug/metabolite transporter (DMT)-like permease